MRATEIRESGELAGLALREVSHGVHRIHRALVRRVRGHLSAALAATLPDGRAARAAAWTARVGEGPVTRLTYGAVALGLVAGGRVGGQLAARRWGDDWAVGDSADALVAFLNGSHGHLLAARRSPLALAATVRVAGADVILTPDHVRRAWPDATGDLAVFVHGVVDTERRWSSRDAGSGEPDTAGLATVLEAELGLSPVLVRYNSGRRVEESAAELGELLEGLLRAWPVKVRRIVLVGHSMGGLVCRRAVVDAAQPSSGGAGDGPPAWLALVTDLVTIGTPHGGAWLEQLVSRWSPRLALLPETAWIGEQLDLRSDGIRDLGGPSADSPPRGCLPPGVNEHAVIGALMGGLGASLGDRVGDLMVGVDSARADLGPDAVAVLPGVHHLGLIRDARVGRQLVSWLAAEMTGDSHSERETERKLDAIPPMLGRG